MNPLFSAANRFPPSIPEAKADGHGRLGLGSHPRPNFVAPFPASRMPGVRNADCGFVVSPFEGSAGQSQNRTTYYSDYELIDATLDGSRIRSITSEEYRQIFSK